MEILSGPLLLLFLCDPSDKNLLVPRTMLSKTQNLLVRICTSVTVLHSFGKCVKAISKWICFNKLKLNSVKSQELGVGPQLLL